MNPNDIPQAGWMWQFVTEAGQWLEPLIYLVGLAISVWAFRRCRKRGYLVIAAYFALVFLWLIGGVTIFKAMAPDQTPGVSEETQQEINAAVKQATDKVLAEHGYRIVSHQQRIYFPVGAFVLTVGVWLLARSEKPVS